LPTRDIHSVASTSRIASTTDAEVLLVEDNLINQKLSRLMLERRGFKVTVVGNGQNALEALAKHSYAVVLMDIRMPVMDGLETIKRIRAEPALRSSLVIATSAGFLDVEKAQALDAGFDHFLTKPVDYDALQNILFDKQAIQGFDFSNAIDTLGGDPEFFYSLTNDYINIYGNADEAFKGFLKAQDIEQAERLVHNIAGLSATFGAENLRLIARKVEQELRAESEVCEESITTFVQELVNLVAAFKEFNERYKAET
jgi:CheY-like chemotaxis protein/HPt (histidine-containing phosphotransfer) domain-containing protein